VTILGVRLTRVQCLAHAVTAGNCVSISEAWAAMAYCLNGTDTVAVGSDVFSKDDCLAISLEIDGSQAAVWRELATWMSQSGTASVKVGDTDIGINECEVRGR
jgi:hypothetical protein